MTLSQGSEVKVSESCPTLCNPMDCSLPGSLVHGILQVRKKTGVGSCSLLQGIFPTQGSNTHLPNCKWTLYCLSHQGSPRKLEWVAYPFSISLTLGSNRGLTAGGLFTSWATREALYLKAGTGRGGPPNHDRWLRLPSVGYILSLKSVLTHSNRLHPMPSPHLPFWERVQHCI